ncbi:MAG: hypothetical protein LBS01_02405 [Prevotellaceae bacterium]|jgi:hypothetical protein|nr:hypothetical protein [Prevotellaceae bacterium]
MAKQQNASSNRSASGAFRTRAAQRKDVGGAIGRLNQGARRIMRRSPGYTFGEARRRQMRLNTRSVRAMRRNAVF